MIFRSNLFLAEDCPEANEWKIHIQSLGSK